MKKMLIVMLCAVCVWPVLTAQSEPVQTEPAVRFVPLDVFINTGSSELGAYQFELNTTAGDVKIVGIEGSQHPAFQNPPYYDPAALANNRIIIAAYSLDEQLPVGNTRIATLHLQITGDVMPEYEPILTAVADANGNQIPATITLQGGN